MFYDISTVQTLRKKLRERFSVEVSLASIHTVAQNHGFRILAFGRKRGYHASVIDTLIRNFNEVLEADAKYKKSKEVRPTDDYVRYNGEVDKADYDWEKKLGEEKVILRMTEGELLKILNESVKCILKNFD